MDERVAGLVPPVRCRFGKCLGLCRLQQLISLENRIHVPYSGHRPSYYPIRAGAAVLRIP
jgi:hypothetical protein